MEYSYLTLHLDNSMAAPPMDYKYGPSRGSKRSRSSSSSSSSSSSYRGGWIRKTKAFRGPKQGGVSHFKESFRYGTDVKIAAAASTSLGAVAFRFQDLTNASSLADVYDMYRLNKVVIKFIPMAQLMTPNQPNSNVDQKLQGNVGTYAGVIGPLHTSIDPDDAVAPASTNAVEQYASHKMVVYGKTHTRTCVPQCIMPIMVSSGGAATGEAPVSKVWLSTSQRGIYFNCVKWGIGATANANADTVLYQVFVTVYYSMKHQK